MSTGPAENSPSTRRWLLFYAVVMVAVACAAGAGSVFSVWRNTGGEFAFVPWLVKLPLLLIGGAIGPLLWYWVRDERPVIRAAALTASYVYLWRWTVFLTDVFEQSVLRAWAARIGTAGLFLIGLIWMIWALEQASRYYDALRRRKEDEEKENPFAAPETDDRNWNPADHEAWYYGRRARRLNQSMTGLMAYTLAFFLTFFLLSQLRGCKEEYEMPAGGGQQQQVTQRVKIQKVIRKKFVINPFSSIIFNPPPIDEIKLHFERDTEHLYKIGDGAGEGAGYSQGTKAGKVRFIRLEYAGGDWDQDFGVGADLNMLIQYNVLTGQKVENRTEARTIAQLGNFKKYKSPPFVYMTGQRNISLSDSEVDTLNEYLLDKHGMIFADNGGSSHFHSQFFTAMKKVLPNIQPVVVPRDDPIHQIPFSIPKLPIVAPHGGDRPWGWKNPDDGRWLVYYHPGDIADAWADGHAGVPREIYDLCYKLGANIINYAHLEYNRWLQAQKEAQ